MHQVKRLLNLTMVFALLTSIILPGTASARIYQAPAPLEEGGQQMDSLTAAALTGQEEVSTGLPSEAPAGWWGTVQESIRRSEYQISSVAQTDLAHSDVVYQAPNRAHNLRLRFTESGLRATPRVQDEGWTWAISLRQIGYGDTLVPVGPASLSTTQNRIEYRRDSLTEWYINDEQGLEQGFTLQAPPQGELSPKGGWLALELALAGDLTPSLVEDGEAIDFFTADGVRVLRYSHLAAYDAIGQRLPARLSLADGNTIRLQVDDAGALYPITIDPLATSPSWMAEGNQASALFGNVVSTAGDVNGDGYSDVIISALFYDNGQTDEGRVYAYHGSPTGLSTVAAWTAEGDQAGARFGNGMGTAGDVNGDGYADVIIAAPYFDNGQTDEGRVFVYHGSASGLSPAADWVVEGDQDSLNLGERTGANTAGDVNSDGYSDVIISGHKYDNDQTDEGVAFVYYGSATGLSLAPDWTVEGNQDQAEFGFAVNTAGDVNGDGYSDVIVGARKYDNGHTDEGVAYVYYGSAAGLNLTPAWMGESDQQSAHFGVSVGTAGDVNGDGYSDIVVGVETYDNDQTNEGAAFVYLGSAAGLSQIAEQVIEGNQASAGLGNLVGPAGDVNGDGYADILMSVIAYDNGQTNEGQARLYLGSGAGLSTMIDWAFETNQANANVGVSTAGDVNGDGYSDIIVGSQYYDNGQTDEGRVWVFHGGSSGPGTASSWSVESEQTGGEMGTSSNHAGDVNGDGYDDVIVGAFLYDNGQTDEGRTYLYLGSPTGLRTSPSWMAESNQIGARFGYPVGTAGDVNNDGYADVIVSAAQYDNGNTDEGRVYVYYGSAAGLSSVADWTAEGDQTEALFGHAAAGTAGDVNDDNYDDIIIGAQGYDNDQTDEGRAFVYHGSAAGLSSIPNWFVESDQIGSQFGRAVSTAGDVNDDGYADVIVGASLFDSGQTDEGKAFLYYGSAGGLNTAPAWTAESNQSNRRFGEDVKPAGDVNDDGYDDIIVSDTYHTNGQTTEGGVFVYHGSASGPSLTADWMVESNQTQAHMGIAINGGGDVNGDGYDDVIVGAQYYNNGHNDEGQAWLYLGSASGLNATASWTGEGNQTDAQYGSSVANAGDVNGDGFSDILVGAKRYDNGQTDEGRVWVYYGSPAGPDATFDWMAEGDQSGAQFGALVNTAGDVNGDGYADVIIGAPEFDGGFTNSGRAFVYLGSAQGLSTTIHWMADGEHGDARFGKAVNTAGDVNGDGYADVIVGSSTFTNGQSGEGKAYVYFGSATGINASVDWSDESDQNGATFGVKVGTAGDVNGDGYSDIIVSGTHYTYTVNDEGAALVYYGSASGPSATPDWIAGSGQSGARYGWSAGTAGDVNGDGYSDVIVGAQVYTNGQANEGAAFVYYGGVQGLSQTPDWITEANQANASYGTAAATAGDVNGDGYADVIVGSPWYSNGSFHEGRVFLYYGAASGLSTSAAWTAESNQSDGLLGNQTGIGTAGDVNGDGYADIFIAAPFYNNGQTDEGQAYLYLGSAAGLGGMPDWTVESNQANARMGESVATAGDVNGDGYADILIGLNLYDNGQTDEGAAWLFYGNGGQGQPLRPRQIQADGLTPLQPLAQTADLTSLQLQLTGRMPLGREKVKLQWQVAPLGTPFTAATIISGTSAAWTDVLTTGVDIAETVDGLSRGTPYHWRARLLYQPGNALGQPASRWVHMPWDGWTEQDFRTQPEAIAGLTAHNSSPTIQGSPTALTATLSAGSPVAYSWDFGDGDFGNGPSANHTYPAAGTYTATVTASNSLGQETASTMVEILEAVVALSIEKTGPASAYVGDPITYTLTISNAGNAAATSLLVTDTVPAGATYLPGSGGTLAGDMVEWTAASLAPDSALSLEFAVVATGTITNSHYAVSADGGNGAVGSQVVETEVSYSCDPVTNVDLHRTLSGYIFAGQPVHFAVTAQGETPFSYDWRLDGQPVGSNVSTYEHTFATPGPYTVQVTVSNVCSQGNDTLAVTVLDPAVDLPNLSQSHKSVSQGSVEEGDVISYTITLRNSNLVAASAVLTDMLPLHTVYVPGSAQASDGSPVVVGQITTLEGSLVITRDVLTWTGQVISGTPAIIGLAAQVETAPIDTQLTNVAYVDDGFGNMYELEANSNFNPGYRLTINEGALYTNNPVVDLRYGWNTARDIVSVKFSNDGGFGPEGDTTDWLAVDSGNPTYEDWTLTTYGNLLLPRTVYARFRDSNGQQYGPVQDDIIYDPVVPVVVAADILPVGRTSVADQATTIRVTAEDDNSGVDRVQLSHQADFAVMTEVAAGGGTVDVSWTIQPPGLVYVRAVDRAGNVSEIVTVQTATTDTFEIFLPSVIK